MMCFTIYGGMINHRHILREAPLIRDFVVVHGFSMISTPGVRHHIEQLKLKIHRPLKQTETKLSAIYKKIVFFVALLCLVIVCLWVLVRICNKITCIFFYFKISKALKISENFSNYNMLRKKMISLPTSARLYIHHDTLDILLFELT